MKRGSVTHRGWLPAHVDRRQRREAFWRRLDESEPIRTAAGLLFLIAGWLMIAIAR